ncbi:hypothetical protein CL622_05680 [archaeon]|nr:hypothetical protein [archaeon]
MLKLTRKTWAAFGYKGGGKSTLSQFIGAEYGDKCLYYDTLHEVPPEVGFHVFQPKNRQNVGELLSVIRLIQANKRYRMLIIDEANRYAKPKPNPLPQAIADMNDWARHPQYNLSVGYVARRPTQLNTDLTEIADYLFIFQLGGKNDIKYLNDLRSGLGDVVQNLPPFHFVVVDQSRNWEVMRPVDIDKIKRSGGQAASDNRA